MIKYLEESIFTSPAQAIVNSVNTVGVMGKGIAATFKKYYPEMFLEYSKLCEDGSLTIGKLYIYKTPNIMIVNFPTKKHWRNPSRVEYIISGLEKFTNKYQDFGISSVSFPQLGCGHGELNWERQVKPIMEKYLANLPIPVYIHLYHKSPNFLPERLDLKYAKEARLERQHVSSEQLWGDLHNLSQSNPKLPGQLSLFVTEIVVNTERIIFSESNSESIVIYRDDIEDFWNILRIRGIATEQDVPSEINRIGASKLLLDLFGRLPYIRKVKLRAPGNNSKYNGLQYAPEPRRGAPSQTDIVI